MEEVTHKKKRPMEFAVIFRKKSIPNRVGTYFTPVSVVIGYYQESTKTFIDINKNQYKHMISSSDGCGFGLRNTVRELNMAYCKRNLAALVKAYFRDLNGHCYYFVKLGEKSSIVYLACEHRLFHRVTYLKDKDFSSLDISSSFKIDARSLTEKVKSKVIGQDEAIEDIVTTLWQNFRSKAKKNMLLVGPTGVGKTEIVKLVAKELNIPFVVVNASGLSKSAYKGEGIIDILRRLLILSNNDVAKAENGIVFLDEFDKLALKEGTEDSVSTSGVQEELLKFIEGGEYEINISNDLLCENNVIIHTNKIIFIAAGSFYSLQRKKQEEASKVIGFGNQVVKSNLVHDFYDHLTSEDLIEYGIISELAGRIPVIISLKPLTEESFIQIIKNPNSDILNDKEQILKEEGIQLLVQGNVYEKIASKAILKNIGVRGLDSTVEALFVKAMKEISLNEGIYEQLIIDEKTVDDPKHYTLVKKREISSS